MAITNRDLPAGTRLVAKFKKEEYACTVERDAEGKTFYVLADGRRFTSPSAAGSAITGGAINGWRFWSVDGDEPPAAPAARHARRDGRRLPRPQAGEAHRQDAEPEGRPGGRGQVLLQRLHEVLHGTGRCRAGGLPGGPQKGRRRAGGGRLIMPSSVLQEQTEVSEEALSRDARDRPSAQPTGLLRRFAPARH
jgi:hypothetical protein